MKEFEEVKKKASQSVGKSVPLANDTANMRTIEKENTELKEKVERYQKTIAKLK